MRWMISCREATEIASRKLDRAATPWERCKLRLHLAFCSACRAAERQMRMLRTLARDLPQALPKRLPDKARERIRARLRAQQARARRGNDHPHQPPASS